MSPKQLRSVVFNHAVISCGGLAQGLLPSFINFIVWQEPSTNQSQPHWTVRSRRYLAITCTHLPELSTRSKVKIKERVQTVRATLLFGDPFPSHASPRRGKTNKKGRRSFCGETCLTCFAEDVGLFGAANYRFSNTKGNHWPDAVESQDKAKKHRRACMCRQVGLNSALSTNKCRWRRLPAGFLVISFNRRNI